MKQHTLSRIAVSLAAGLVGWIAIWHFGLKWSSQGEILWTGLLYLLCGLPTVLFALGHRFRIPFMPMWGLGYFMLFGMPMLSPENQFFDSIAPEQVVAALRLTVMGAAACLLFFYTPAGKWLELFLPRIQAPWNPERAPFIGSVLCLIGTSFNYYRHVSPPSASLSQLLFVGSQLAIIGILTLFLLHLRGLLSWKLKIFLWGFIMPLELLIGFGTGAVYNALVVLAPLLFIYAAERGSIPWIPASLILLFCFIPFSGFKSEYRSYAWYGEEGDVRITESPIQKGTAFIELVVKRLSEGGFESYTVAAESAQARVSHLDVLIEVMEITPASIPYWNGETYLTLLWAPIPRVLFPNKPTKDLGQAFGHRYGFLTESDVMTSFNLPHQVIEMYINFGTLGVLIGMALLGLLYRMVATLISREVSGERALIIGCGTLTILLSMDSDLSLVLAGIIYYIPLLYLATQGLGLKKPAATSEPLSRTG